MNNLYKSYKRLLILANSLQGLAKTSLYVIILSAILANFIVPCYPVFAASENTSTPEIKASSSFIGDYAQRFSKILNYSWFSIDNIDNNNESAPNRLPQSNDSEVAKITNLLLTAYTSEEAQTDSSPCITANGFDLCKQGIEDTLAINGVKFGTKVRIPDLFGDRVFIVRDRMNAKYSSNRGDIWMNDKNDAIKFGAQLARVEILK